MIKLVDRERNNQKKRNITIRTLRKQVNCGICGKFRKKYGKVNKEIVVQLGVKIW